MGNFARTGDNPGEHNLSPSSVGNLSLLWKFVPGGPVEGSPTIVNGTVYVGSQDGYLYALDATNGTILWKSFLGQINDSGCTWLSPGGVYTAPSYANGDLYVAGPTTLYKLNASNGHTLWSDYVGVYVWASPFEYNGYVYEGVASHCDNPLVQGELRQYYASNGNLDHVFYVVGSAGSGDSGGSIWSTPALDTAANVVWVTTGNENSCECYSRSVVALNATTLQPLGYWQEPYAGYDYDFGAGPTLLSDASGHSLVLTTNKDGYTRTFNRTNVSSSGWKPIWVDQTTSFTPFLHPPANAISPAAFDGKLAFVGGGNTSVGGRTVLGAVSAIYPSNGTYAWRTATPGVVRAALSTADGLVAAAISGQHYYSFAGRYLDINNSTVEVLDAANGTVLFRSAIPLDLNGPAVFAEGKLFVGAASANLTGWNTFANAKTTTGAVYAFGLKVVPKLNASFTFAPTTGSAPISIAFDATASGGSWPYSYSWNFGDGTTINGSASPTHLYAAGGRYVVELTASDAAKTMVKVVRAITVGAALSATMTANPTTGTVGVTVSLAVFATGGTTPYRYLWSFSNNGSLLWAGKDLNVTLQSAGVDTVNVTVLDSAGHLANASANVTVGFPPFFVHASASTSKEPGGILANFSETVSGGTAPFTYSWTFGDGGLGSGSNPSHAFRAAGAFSVVLTVLDQTGRPARAYLNLTVLPSSSSLTVGIRLLSASGPSCSAGPSSVVLLANASSGRPPYSYSWSGAAVPGGASGAELNLSPGISTNRTVSVVAHDGGGFLAEANFTFPLEAPPPCNVASTTGPEPWVLAAVLVGLAVALPAAFLVLAARRRRSRP